MVIALLGAIPIPGGGGNRPSSSNHSTPAGSLGTPSFMDRASGSGSGPVPDSNLTHQSPLIVGTPPIAQVRLSKFVLVRLLFRDTDEI